MRRIPGPAILGVSDLFVGAALQKPVVLVRPGAKAPPGPQLAAGPGARPGAVAKPAGKAAPGSQMKGGGKTAAAVPVRMVKGGTNKDGFGQAKASVYNAFKAGDRALTAAKRAAASVKKHKTGVKIGLHSPIVPLAIVDVRDDGQVVLGAVKPVTKKPLTPVQQQAVKKHTASIAKTAAATRRLAALSKKAQAAGTAAKTAARSTTDAIAKSLKPKWAGTRMGDAVADLALLDAYYDYVGAGPDEERPGYLTDGSLDPVVLLGGAEFDLTAGADSGAGPDPMADPNAPVDTAAVDAAYNDMSAQDVGEGAVVAPDGTVLYDPAKDPEVIPLPVRGQALPSDDQLHSDTGLFGAGMSFQNPPDDAIPYDGSRGLPENCVGSWNAFYGAEKHDGWGVPSFLRGSVDGGKTIQWLFCSPETRDKGFTVAGREFQTSATSGAPDAKAVSANSIHRGWGPIVGNPSGPLANLQYAIATGTWFWQGPAAPTWATAETDAKIMAANKKIREANRAAALVQAAQMAKDLFEQAQAKAKQDAANALAMSAADTQSEIARKQVEAQKSQLEVQTEKAELDAQKAEAQIATQQAAIELQAQQAQDKLEAEAQHQLVSQADIWNKWAAQNPEEAVVLMTQGMSPGGANYGGPGGGGDAYYEDEYYEAEGAYGPENDGPRMYGGEDEGEEDEGGGEYLEDD